MKNSCIKILFLSGELGFGGAERQLYYLCTELDKKRFDPAVANLNPDLDHYWADQLKAAGIPIYSISKHNRLLKVWEIHKLIDKFQPDIFYSLLFVVNQYAVLARSFKRLPTIGGIRSFPNREDFGRVSIPGQWLGLYGVDRLVCNAKSSQEYLFRHYPRLRNIDVIPNGVPIFSELELRARRDRFFSQFPPDKADVIIGYVGHLREIKNVPLLIRAFAALAPEFPQLKLFIVGDGQKRQELENLTKDLGVDQMIHFTGYRPKAEELIPAFDILCLPSHREGMPNVVMEAGAAAIPVIASNIPGIAEIVIDRATGLLFTPGDLDDLIQKLRSLIQDPDLRRKLGRSAYQYLSENYSISSMVQRYERLFENLVDSNQSF